MGEKAVGVEWDVYVDCRTEGGVCLCGRIVPDV